MDAAQDLLGLDVLDGAARGTRLALPVDGSAVLGRSDDADLQLPDEGVSRHHALIVVDADGVVVRDLGSTNGTTLNGRPLEGSHALVDGDVLRLAGVRLRCSSRASEPDAAATSTLGRPRPERTSEPTSERTSEWREPVARAASVGRRVVAGVLTLGGLAGAVTGVRALWPAPDPQDRGVITSAAVAVDQPLSSFVPNPRIRPRADAAAPSSQELREPGMELVGSSSAVVDLDPTPIEPAGQSAPPPVDEQSATSTPIPDGPAPTATVEPEGTQEPTADPTGTGEAGPEELSPAEEARVLQLDAPSVLELSPQQQEDRLVDVFDDPALAPWRVPVLAPPVVEPEVGAGQGTPLVARSHPVYSALGEEGDQLAADEAARRLSARLEKVRSRQSGDQRDLLGAEATVDVELEGLRGTPLLLFWQLVPVGAQVPSDWSTAVVAYRLTPGTDRDVASLPVWVPLPAAKGLYHLRLYLEHEEEDRILDTHLTEPFS